MKMELGSEVEINDTVTRTWKLGEIERFQKIWTKETK